MARVEIPFVVLTSAGVPVSGASAQVNIRAGGTPATVFAAETGGTTLTNPLTTDSLGRIEGWVDEGSYAIVVSGGTITTYTQQFEAVRGDGVGRIANGIVVAQHMAAGSVTYRMVQTFTVAGAIRVPSGDTDFIPPFRVNKLTGQTVKVAQIAYRLNNGAVGTTVTFSLQNNGSNMTGFTGLTTPNNTTWTVASPTAVTLADGDVIGLVVTAIVGGPLNLSVSVSLEHGN